MLKLNDYKQWFSQNKNDLLEDYFTLLRFPSISTDPAYSKDVHACMTWLSDYLKERGFAVEVWPTSRYPVIFATHLEAGPSRPTLLLYNHYDVQPVDPLELWQSPPFEPTIRDNCVYARGASDNKGQLSYTLSALRAYMDLAKQHRLNLKLFIEGEEECGSVGTSKVLVEKKKSLSADYCLVIDSGVPHADTPAVTLGVRGMTTMEISLHNSKIDLHSGVFGGIALNPNQVLVTLLANLWENGRVAVPGFYDEVTGLSIEDWSVLDHTFDRHHCEKQFGIRAFGGEAGYSVHESNWIRPTLEINGMWGGYTGSGFKTVIPSSASAKISCRLVPKQDPDTIAKRVIEHCRRMLPKGIEMKYEIHAGGLPAYTSSKSRIVSTSKEAYKEVFGKECSLILSSASVPIVADLAAATGAEMALIGTATNEDDIHAPNEHFSLNQYHRGFLVMSRILALLSQS